MHLIKTHYFIQLHHVPEASLQWCQQLSRLDLSNNNLTSLANQTFAIVPRLQTLNLSSCSLNMVSSITLRNLSQLTTLDLSHNNLRSVPTHQLSSLTSLKTLVLSGNYFTALGPHSFRELHKLQQLYASNCPLLRYWIQNTLDEYFLIKTMVLRVQKRRTKSKLL